MNIEIDNAFDEDELSHEPLIRWVTFFLGNEIYGVEVKCVREILKINNILPVPGAPDYVLGITNVRGNVVSVIDGRKRLNLELTKSTEKSRMIVLESENEFVAVVVDNVADIVDISESSLDSNPKVKSSEESRYVTGVFSNNDDLIIALNAERLITNESYDVASSY